MNFVTEDFKNRLEGRIRELEAESSVEFVPALISRASNYLEARLLRALFVWGLLLIAARFVAWHGPYFVEVLVASLIAVGVFFALGNMRIARLLLPKYLKLRAVSERAEKLFMFEEVFATRDRTGVLILVSLFERAVFILADKGLKAKVSDQEWAALAERLAKDFDHQNPGASFEALKELSVRLKHDFPPQSENANELQDRLRHET